MNRSILNDGARASKPRRPTPLRNLMDATTPYFPRLAASIWVLAAGGVLAAAPAPGVRIPVNALPSGPATQSVAGTVGGKPVFSPQVVSGSFSPYQVRTNANGSVQATVTQNGNAGILQWSSFDIGSSATVSIVQPSSTAVLLNKVSGGAFNNMTLIEGILNANGQVYIANPNGIVFGKSSQVNVNSLVATTLKIDDSRFLSGILNPSFDPFFGASTSAPASIVVEGDDGSQAVLTADPGGRVMLVAPQVSNNGVITARDGQVILAAGRTAFVSAPSDSNMRGLLVAVRDDAGDSAALNDKLGKIVVGHGNATLMGLAVNQNGSVSANTSVNLNGSIYLRAATAGNDSPSAPGALPGLKTAGKLTLGAGSQTRVDPDLADSAGSADDPKFKPSVIDLVGKQIVLQGSVSDTAGTVTPGAIVVAKGGGVSITARNDLSGTPTNFAPSRVDFGAGSLVDVSGSTDTKLAMESNVIKVELRGPELADNPVLRNDPAVMQQSAQVDVRVTYTGSDGSLVKDASGNVVRGTQIANISGWVSQVTHTVGERTAQGGTVSVVSDGDIVQRAGSRIDVSGGKVEFLDGYINTSKLLYGGVMRDIGSAPANLPYDKIITPTSSDRTFEKGYVQGYSAGTVTFSAPAMALQGDLAGSVTLGPKQRDVAAAGRPLGGTVNFGNVKSGRPDVVAGADNLGFRGNIVIGSKAQAIDLASAAYAYSDTAAASPLPSTLGLDLNELGKAGFSRVGAVAGKLTDTVGGDITLAGVQSALPAGGSLTLGAAGSIRIDAAATSAPSISIPGGSVTMVAGQELNVSGPGASRATFDLAGRWTNDGTRAGAVRDAQGYLTGDIVRNGGALDLSAQRINVANASIDVSAGAALDAAGKLTTGAAGKVTLEARVDLTSADSSLSGVDSASLAGFGFTNAGNIPLVKGSLFKGGTVSLTGRNVNISPDGSDVDDVDLPSSFFDRGGFTSFSLTAKNDLNVAGGTIIEPRAQAWRLSSGYATFVSGAMGNVASVVVPNLTGPSGGRLPVSISLDATDRTVLGTGAKLSLDPKATVSLTAGRQVTIDGAVTSPGGQILIGLTAGVPAATDATYDPTRSIWFGSNANLSAAGTSDLVYSDGRGISSGDVLAGGSIRIGRPGAKAADPVSAATGYVVAQAGSTFDVGGTTSDLLRFKSDFGISQAQRVGSDAGSIEMRAREGILFDGVLKGKAGSGARGGSLTVALDREGLTATGVAPDASGTSPVGAYPQQARELTIVAKAPAGGFVGDASQVNALKADGSIYKTDANWVKPSAYANGGAGWLALDSFKDGGFDRLTLKSQDVLSFAQGSSGMAIGSGSSIVLDAQTFRVSGTAFGSANTGDVDLNSAYVQLGSADWRYQAPQAKSGVADGPTLSVTAKGIVPGTGTIDLVGNSTTQGFGKVQLAADADIRMTGVVLRRTDGTLIDPSSSPNFALANDKLASPYIQGSFATGGDLSLTSAQTYVTTLSDFRLDVAGNAAFSGGANRGVAQPPLSAAGKLGVYAGTLETVTVPGTATSVQVLRDRTGTITQDGVLLAPFGTITLEAARELKYGAGSVTSVAGQGNVPLGTIQNGRDWIYDFGNGWAVNFTGTTSSSSNLLQVPLPEKGVTSKAPKVELAAAVRDANGNVVTGAALIDARGGGALYGYEFTPGPGGSRDVLARATTGGVSFAVVPGFTGSVAPADTLYGKDSILQPGDSIYLSGMPGLPAGTYTLLPAHYALSQPNAFVVTAAANTQGMQATRNGANPDGTQLVAGYRFTNTTGNAGSTGDRLAGSGFDGRWSGYTVLSAAQARQRSEYTEYTASSFFGTGTTAGGNGAVALPGDGGHVVFDLSRTLLSAQSSGAISTLNNVLKLGDTRDLTQADGSVSTEADRTVDVSGASGPSAGRRGYVDISATVADLTVTGSNARKASLDATAGGVNLTTAALKGLAADSLLLGGVRYASSDGTQHVAVNTNNVTIGAGKDAATGGIDAASLTGPDIIVAAKNTLTVNEGAKVTGTGTPDRAPVDLTVVTASNTASTATGADAEGALVRVSGQGASLVRRGALAASVTSGILALKKGAQVGGDGAVVLDSTKGYQVASGVLNLDHGPALAVGASSVSLGDGIPDAVGGFKLDALGIAAFNKLSSLSLSSYAAPIGFYGTADQSLLLGNKDMFLTLQSQGIQAFGVKGASIAASSLRLVGGAGYTLADSSTSTGSPGALSITARDINFDSGDFQVSGFARVGITATREAKGTGSAGIFKTGSDLSLAAGRITAASGSDTTIRSTGGTLSLNSVAAPESPVGDSPLGGRLRFVGNTALESNANIQAHAGRVDMTVDGASSYGLVLGKQFVRDAAGKIATDAAGKAMVEAVDKTSSVDVSGVTKSFGEIAAYAPGGSIYLDGGAGGVVAGAKSVLDVSSTGASAGLLSVATTNGKDGKASLGGVLRGAASPGADGAVQQQGSFSLSADTIPDFGSLGALLNAAGFTDSLNIRVRNDDLALNATESLKARQLVIAADRGNVTIGGKIDATGASGGSVEIYAAGGLVYGNTSQPTIATAGKGNVVIQSGAIIDASANVAATGAAGSIGDGGRIVIGTATSDSTAVADLTAKQAGSNLTYPDQATISVASGAKLDVSGNGTSAQGGAVQLRAPRRNANNEIAVRVTDALTLGNAVNGAGEFTLEAYKVYGNVSAVAAANVETITTTSGTTSAITPSGTYYTESNAFLSTTNKAAMQARIGTAAALRAGVELRSASAPGSGLAVSVNETAANPQDRGWNLNAWRFGGQPGVLTLRATGDLTVNGSISDGFVKPASGTAAANKQGMPDWAPDTTSGASWSYRLVGGADFGAANPLAVVPAALGTSGDVKLTFARAATTTATDQPVALIRTGTGRIDIAAGRDISIGSITSGPTSAQRLLGGQIYTAGRVSSTTGFTPPANPINSLYAASAASRAATFGMDGGDITLVAERNVTGVPTLQMVNNWLFRQGRIASEDLGDTGATTAWWSRPDYFNQGIATFAGGDISVVARTGNVTDLSASAATDAYVAVPGASPVQQGGGDLSVRAGGDIKGGVFYVQKGAGNLRADGSIAQGTRAFTNSAWQGTQFMYPVLAMGDASFQLTAGRNLSIEGVFNPTLANQSKANLGLSGSTSVKDNASIPVQYGAYSTYGAGSAVRLTAITGDLGIIENQKLISIASNSGSATVNDMPATAATDFLRDQFFQIMPGSLTAAALNGSVTLSNGFSLWPDANGSLNLIAAGSVQAGKTLTSGWNQPLVMLDIASNALPSPENPRKLVVSGPSQTQDFNLWAGKADGLNAHANTGLHAGDTAPVRIVAAGGDINFSSANTQSTPLILPKSAQITASGDIRDLGFKIQNLASTDVTKIEAGRDIIDTTIATGTSNVSHQVGGPGRADFLAGRNIDLGNGQGIVTRGNLDNPYLPVGTGASLVLQAGARADYARFVQQQVALTAAEFPAVDQAALIAYVKKNDPTLAAELGFDAAVAAFMAPKGLDGKSDQILAYQTAFYQGRAADFEARKPYFDQLYFNKIAIATGAVGGGTLDLAKFDAVIGSLYPGLPTSKAASSLGDINVFGSQVKTESGGSIDIFAPGGSVFAGLTSVPAYLASKEASKLGIFTIKGGAINSLVNSDFLVNQGRVFTLGGGDITLVSQYGDIDAGKGAKTAAATPPPLLKIDSTGNVSVDISSSIAGSGIATLQAGANVPPSNVYPIAPRGTFDAGDAGVRSSGSVVIVADKVLNAGNIVAAGTVSGGKSADTSGLAAAVSAPPAAPVAKADNFTNAANPNADAASTLTVELLGFGNAANGGSGAASSQPSAAPRDADADTRRREAP